MTKEEYISCKNKGTCPLIIDVREKEEWDSGHIDGAVHIPLAELKERINACTEDKNMRIAVCCAHGSRGEIAKQLLQQQGYTAVENLDGGYFGLQ